MQVFLFCILNLVRIYMDYYFDKFGKLRYKFEIFFECFTTFPTFCETSNCLFSATHRYWWIIFLSQCQCTEQNRAGQDRRLGNFNRRLGKSYRELPNFPRRFPILFFLGDVQRSFPNLQLNQ